MEWWSPRQRKRSRESQRQTKGLEGLNEISPTLRLASNQQSSGVKQLGVGRRIKGSWLVAVVVPDEEGSQGQARPAQHSFGSAEIWPKIDFVVVALPAGEGMAYIIHYLTLFFHFSASGSLNPLLRSGTTVQSKCPCDRFLFLLSGKRCVKH